MTTKLDEFLDVLDAEIGEDVQAIVTEIEARPETTKGHYGDYMDALGYFSRRGLDGPLVSAVGLVMRRHGANGQGIYWALKLIGAHPC